MRVLVKVVAPATWHGTGFPAVFKLDDNDVWTPTEHITRKVDRERRELCLTFLLSGRRTDVYMIARLDDRREFINGCGTRLAHPMVILGAEPMKGAVKLESFLNEEEEGP